MAPGIENQTPFQSKMMRGLAARRTNACRSSFATRDAVRRRSTATAPARPAASFCHACRLRIRRIEIGMLAIYLTTRIVRGL